MSNCHVNKIQRYSRRLGKFTFTISMTELLLFELRTRVMLPLFSLSCCIQPMSLKSHRYEAGGIFEAFGCFSILDQKRCESKMSPLGWEPRVFVDDFEPQLHGNNSYFYDRFWFTSELSHFTILLQYLSIFQHHGDRTGLLSIGSMPRYCVRCVFTNNKGNCGFF